MRVGLLRSQPREIPTFLSPAPRSGATKPDGGATCVSRRLPRQSTPFRKGWKSGTAVVHARRCQDRACHAALIELSHSIETTPRHEIAQMSSWLRQGYHRCKYHGSGNCTLPAQRLPSPRRWAVRRELGARCSLPQWAIGSAFFQLTGARLIGRSCPRSDRDRTQVQNRATRASTASLSRSVCRQASGIASPPCSTPASPPATHAVVSVSPPRFTARRTMSA